MTQAHLIKAYRFCCEISKANGEDPIGSAGNYAHLLLVEMPEPWPEDFVYDHPQLGVIHKMTKALQQERRIMVKVMAYVAVHRSPTTVC
jgi:hypothetical protein